MEKLEGIQFKLKILEDERNRDIVAEKHRQTVEYKILLIDSFSPTRISSASSARIDQLISIINLTVTTNICSISDHYVLESTIKLDLCKKSKSKKFLRNDISPLKNDDAMLKFFFSLNHKLNSSIGMT